MPLPDFRSLEEIFLRIHQDSIRAILDSWRREPLVIEEGLITPEETVAKMEKYGTEDDERWAEYNRKMNALIR